MSYTARVFRILIASPSDVQEERDVAVKTIQEWNDLNSSERQVVLLPLRWESHSAPEYGKRPQEIINRQVVDFCDLLVGVFWTRIGSPTGSADSGTIEEIERVASQGKPVMLYFSQAKQDPDKIDIEQLSKLRVFKEKTFPRALVENFGNLVEFRDKLAKQLEIQIRELIGDVTGEASEASSIRSVTDVQFHFANPDTGDDLGNELEIETTHFEIIDLDKVADYTDEQKRKSKTLTEKEDKTSDVSMQISTAIDLFNSTVNKDYYRDIVDYFVQQNLYRPIRFWIKNIGGIGARDVYIETRVQSEKDSILIIPSAAIKSKPNRRGDRGYSINFNYLDLFNDDRDIRDDAFDNNLFNSIELRSLQPQRAKSPKVRWFIGAKDSCEASIQARIYADTLAEPLIRTLKLRINVKQVKINANDLVQEYIASQESKD